MIKALGTQGVIGIQDQKVLDVSNYVLTKNTGWIIAIVFTVGLAAASFGTYFSRRRAGNPFRHSNEQASNGAESIGRCCRGNVIERDNVVGIKRCKELASYLHLHVNSRRRWREFSDYRQVYDWPS